MKTSLKTFLLFAVSLFILEAIMMTLCSQLGVAPEIQAKHLLLNIINYVLIIVLWLAFFFYTRQTLADQLLTSIKSGGSGKSERAVEQLTAQIQQYYDEKNLMITALAHDIRTPLTEALLRIELMENPPSEMTDIINNLNNINHIVVSSLEYAKEPDNLKTYHADIVGLLTTIVQEKRSDEFDLYFDSDIDHYDMEVEGALFKRMIINLIDNAKQYATSCRLSLVKAEQVLTIICEDDGPGVPDKFLDLLAIPFFRVDEARTDTQGTGLGLAIVKKIASMHDATVQFENCGSSGFRVVIVWSQLA